MFHTLIRCTSLVLPSHRGSRTSWNESESITTTVHNLMLKLSNTIHSLITKPSKKLYGLINTGSHKFCRDGVRVEGIKKILISLKIILNSMLDNWFGSKALGRGAMITISCRHDLSCFMRLMKLVEGKMCQAQMQSSVAKVWEKHMPVLYLVSISNLFLFTCLNFLPVTHSSSHLQIKIMFSNQELDDDDDLGGLHSQPPPESYNGSMHSVFNLDDEDNDWLCLVKLQANFVCHKYLGNSRLGHLAEETQMIVFNEIYLYEYFQIFSYFIWFIEKCWLKPCATLVGGNHWQKLISLDWEWLLPFTTTLVR